MLGCQGHHPALRSATPNIDALAKRGTLFRNAYCTNPICCPSRANMLSGTYSHECESWNNYKGLETGMWTYVRGMEEKGYQTKLLGKHYDHLTGHHTIMNRVADCLEPLNREGKAVMDQDTAQEIVVLDSEEKRCHEQDWNMFDEAGQYLEERSEAENDAPFFLGLNPGLVHAAFVTNTYWLNKVPEDLIDVPPVDPSDHPAEVYQRKSKAWRQGFDDETVKKVRRIYFAMCAEADTMIGELLDVLEATGLSENTTVIFSSDHGELAMEHQQYYKMSHFEASARIPLIIAGPDLAKGQTVETPVSLIDMAPTICDLADMPHRQAFSGESLLPVAKGDGQPERGWAMAMYSGVTTNTISYMIRQGNDKLIAYEGYAPRLFDLAQDPAELHDLAEERPERREELLKLLDAQVDREETLALWEEYRRTTFAMFRRQAKRGLYLDNSYGLRHQPSSAYDDIMGNAFTGWDGENEKRVSEWLSP